MNDTVPVVAGQVRKGEFGIYWGVIRPHRRRPGFWVCTSHEFPYDVIHAGRRQLEELPLVEPGAAYTDPHPGLDYWASFEGLTEVGRG